MNDASMINAKRNKLCRLRLFLEQFGIPTCVLNSEMPVNSRCHVVHQFNEGRYDYMVASDVADMGGHELEEPTDASGNYYFLLVFYSFPIFY